MTPNKEDYLKCIYEIGSRHKKITNKEIAQLMQVSPPAVTEMMKKMLAEELLVKDKKAGYLLTDLGLRLVSDLYRKHRLIEVFLVNHLGYSTDEIHEEAEVLEHTVSERSLSVWMPCSNTPRPVHTEVPFQPRESFWTKKTN